MPVRICSPEDLIIHKIISERPRDREEVKGIIQAMGKELDRQFLDRMIRSLDLMHNSRKPSNLGLTLATAAASARRQSLRRANSHLN